MLTVDNLRAGYGAREVLHDVSLDVAQGKIAVLLGANGAGKSTTLGALVGSVKKSGGSVKLGDTDITNREVAENVRGGLTMVPEGGRVFRDFTVAENLRLGAFTAESAADVAERQERVLHIFPRLRERLGQHAGTMSGGERQMLAIGRALMAKPRMLLLDEPFLGLAPAMVEAVATAIQQINQEQGVTFLVVEQNVQIIHVADRAYVMRLGEVVIDEANPRSLLDDERLETSFIG